MKFKQLITTAGVVIALLNFKESFCEGRSGNLRDSA